MALNPKTRIVFDDARHYLMTTRDKYYIISSDPLDVFVKGIAALYSKDYIVSVKRHLNPGGMFDLQVIGDGAEAQSGAVGTNAGDVLLHLGADDAR